MVDALIVLVSELIATWQPLVTRLYRVHAAGASIHMEPVPVRFDSLDPGFVFVLDTGNKIFIWYGKTAKSTLKSKARLMAEKVNKNERKNKAEIMTEFMSSESEDFLSCLNMKDCSRLPPIVVS